MDTGLGGAIRSAMTTDADALAAVRVNSMQDRYRGFFTAEMIESFNPDNGLPVVWAWLSDAESSLDVLERNGKVQSYIVYRKLSEDLGRIDEIRTTPPDNPDDAFQMIWHVIGMMAKAGCHTLETWILHDDFRTRFLFETLGFRPDGQRDFRMAGEERFEFMRYVYQDTV